MKFIQETMKNWKEELAINGKTLGEKGENPARFAFAVTICNYNDASQLHI